MKGEAAVRHPMFSEWYFRRSSLVLIVSLSSCRINLHREKPLSLLRSPCTSTSDPLHTHTSRGSLSLKMPASRKSCQKSLVKITTKLMNAVNLILCHNSWIVVRGSHLQPQYATRESVEKDQSLERQYQILSNSKTEEQL